MQKLLINSTAIRMLLCCALFGVIAVASAQNKTAFKSVNLQINDIKLEVEYADNFELRSRGLMFRKAMCEQCGMLFNFEQPRMVGMWMKNTFIPLDVAFIDKQGVITDIKPMQPHDLTSVTSSKAILFALEMNQGWFSKHGVKVGDRVIIE